MKLKKLNTILLICIMCISLLPVNLYATADNNDTSSDNSFVTHNNDSEENNTINNTQVESTTKDNNTQPEKTMKNDSTTESTNEKELDIKSLDTKDNTLKSNSNNELNITYNAGNGYFSDGNTTNVVTYNTNPEKKYSHTPNISDDGTRSGAFGKNLSTKDTITIEGAEKLHIEVSYGTYSNTSSSYAQLHIIPGEYAGNISYSAISGEIARLRGFKDHDVPMTVSYDIDGDTVTFGFYSGSSNYNTYDETQYYQVYGYGYYATVTEVPKVTEGEYKEPISSNSLYVFDKWDKDINKLTSNDTLTAQYKLISAYAVLDDQGNFTFFRSPETYTNNTTGTFTDVEGNEYTGRIFSDVETRVGWSSYYDKIKNVSFKQLIQPTSTSSWFYNTTLDSIDFTNFDASKINSLNGMFRDCTIEELDATWLEDIDWQNIYNTWLNFYSQGIKKIKLPNINNEYISLDGYYKNGNTIISSSYYDNSSHQYITTDIPAGTYTRVDAINIQVAIYCNEKVNLPITMYCIDEEIEINNSTYNYTKELSNYYIAEDYSSNFAINSNEYQIRVVEDNDSTLINRKYTITIDVPQTTVSGTIEWKEDDISKRPETVTIELYQNGEIIDSKEISSSDTFYMFEEPVRDENGKIYDYEVKESPVTNYITTYEEIDAMQLLLYPQKCYGYDYGTGNSDEKSIKASSNNENIEGFYFRRHGKWYYMTWNNNYYFNNYRNRLIIPGDAVYIKFKQESMPVRLQSTSKAKSVSKDLEEYNSIYNSEYTGLLPYDMDKESTAIADSWSEYEANSTINAKTWYNNNKFLSQYDSDGKIIVTPLNETDASMSTKNFYEDEGVAFNDQSFIGLNNLNTNNLFSYNIYNKVLYGSLFRTNILNVSKDTKIDISGTKVWEDEDRTPPEEVTIRLLQNGEIYKEETISANDDWKYLFENVPQFNENGEKYVYTISEKPIKGYKYRTEDTSNKALKIKFKVNEDILNEYNSDFNSMGIYAYAEKDGQLYEFGDNNLNSNSMYRPYLSPMSLIENDNGIGTLYFPTTDIHLLFEVYEGGVVGLASTGNTLKSNRSLGDWLTITSVEVVDNPYEYDSGVYFWNNMHGGKWQKINYTPPEEMMSNLDVKTSNEEWDLNNLYTSGKIYTNPAYGDIYRYDGVNYDFTNKDINIINKYYEGDLSIIKKDEQGNPLANTLFSLYWTENTLEDQEWTKAETTPTATGLSDNEGNLVIKNIPYGCYLLEETPTPGYSKPSKPWKVVVNTNGTVSVFDENGELVPISGTTLSADNTNGLSLVLNDSYDNNAVLYYELDGNIYQVQKELTGTIDIPSKTFYISAINAEEEIYPEWRDNIGGGEYAKKAKSNLLEKAMNFFAKALGIRDDITNPTYKSGGIETIVKFNSIDPKNVSMSRNDIFITTKEDWESIVGNIIPYTDIALPMEINEAHDTYKYTYQDPNYLVSPEREEAWQNSAIQIKFGDVIEGNPDGEVAILVSDGTKYMGEYVPTHYVKLTNNQLDDNSSIIHRNGFYITDADALANKTITVPGTKVWIWDNWATSNINDIMNPIDSPVEVRSYNPVLMAKAISRANNTNINIESIELVESTDYSELIELDSNSYIDTILYDIPMYFGIDTVVDLSGNTQTLDPQNVFNTIVAAMADFNGIEEEYLDQYYVGTQNYGFAVWAYEKEKLQNEKPTYEIENKKTKTEIRLINTDDEYVPGGVLELYDKDGNLVDTWTTTEDWHLVEGLTEGETYTIKNPSIPFIYNYADDKEFIVNVGTDTKVTVVVDPAPKVEISNTIIGAEFVHTDELTYEITLEGARKNNTYPINIGNQTVNITTDANGNGNATFNLKNGEVAILNTVHKNTTVTVKEQSSEYYASYTATRNSTTVEEKANTETQKDITTSGIVMTNDNLRIDFVNEISVIVPTGVANNITGIVLAILAMLSLLIFIGIKKQKSVTKTE